MDAPEGATLTGQEAQELLDAFGAMAPLLKKSSLATNDGGRDHKKAKTQHKPKETDQQVDLHPGGTTDGQTPTAPGRGSESDEKTRTLSSSTCKWSKSQ